MKNIKLLGVMPEYIIHDCADELDRSTYWNVQPGRTAPDSSPHHDASDLWVRYHPGDKVCDWLAGSDSLPSTIKLARWAFDTFEAVSLGGILVTRIAPGACIKPHIDKGWHATTHKKIAIQLKADPASSFCFDDGEFKTQPGDVYTFNNQVTHWVTNNSDKERMTLFICIKTGD